MTPLLVIGLVWIVGSLPLALLVGLLLNRRHKDSTAA